MVRGRLVTLLLALVAALPIVAICVWSLRQAVSGMNDPCVTWGEGPDGSGTASISIAPDDPCKVKTVHGSSKAKTLLVAGLVPGTLLVSALLAVAGAAFLRRRVLLAGAIGILAETIFVFTIAPLTLLAGLGLLLLARRVP